MNLGSAAVFRKFIGLVLASIPGNWLTCHGLLWFSVFPVSQSVESWGKFCADQTFLANKGEQCSLDTEDPNLVSSPNNSIVVEVSISTWLQPEVSCVTDAG